MNDWSARPLKHLLRMTREAWEHDDTRPAAREAFRKVLDCGTAALGAEVFASEREERIVYHTCKSRACPSCGHRATKAWQRGQWRELPGPAGQAQASPLGRIDEEKLRGRSTLGR